MFLTMKEFFLVNSDDCFGMWLTELIANTFVVIESGEIRRILFGVVWKKFEKQVVSRVWIYLFFRDIAAKYGSVYRKFEWFVRIWKIDFFLKIFRKYFDTIY